MGRDFDGSIKMSFQFRYYYYKDQVIIWVPYFCKFNTKTSKDTMHIKTGPWRIFPEPLHQDTKGVYKEKSLAMQASPKCIHDKIMIEWS